MNRKFMRLSLGGVRQARSAAIAGRISGPSPADHQILKRPARRIRCSCWTEVDKMSMDFRGDPSAALLSARPGRITFLDHCLDVEYDLSSVVFICTANLCCDPAGAARPHGSAAAGRLTGGRSKLASASWRRRR
jgi:ATP-dependent Lon protease